MVSSSVAAFFIGRCAGPVGIGGGGRLVGSPPFISFFRRNLSALGTVANRENMKSEAEKEASSSPLLMLSSREKPQSRFFFDLADGKGGGCDNSSTGTKLKLNREMALEEIADHHCIGCSQGFLITIDISISKQTKIHATNPLTGATLPLPSNAALSHLKESPVWNGKFILRNPLTRDGRPVLLDKQFELLYKEGKAVLSPSLTTIFVMSSLLPLLARIGRDTSWTSSAPHPLLISAANDIHAGNFHKNAIGGPTDCIFHRGLLHVLWDEALIVVDTDNPLKPAKVSSLRLPSDRNHLKKPVEMDPPSGYQCKLSLAESPNGDDLFLVSRVFVRERSEMPYATEGFKVYKLVEVVELGRRKYTWEEMQCIGDFSLLVSHGSTMAFSVNGCPNFLANCIYFANENHCGSQSDVLQPVKTSDAGVYHLGDKTIEFYELRDGVYDSFNWRLPLWYMPSPLKPPSHK